MQLRKCLLTSTLTEYLVVRVNNRSSHPSAQKLSIALIHNNCCIVLALFKGETKAFQLALERGMAERAGAVPVIQVLLQPAQ